MKVNSKTNRIEEFGQAGEAAATAPGDARQGLYMLAVGKNGAGPPVGAAYDGPTLDYKVHVKIPGTYRLYLRWAGKDDNTDSHQALRDEAKNLLNGADAATIEAVLGRLRGKSSDS